MITKRQKTMRATASLFIVLSLAPYYVLGNFIKPISNAAPNTTATRTSTKSEPRMAGRLVTRGSLPVMVNGYGSFTGTTILTGATIQTPTGVRATVQLAELGSLDLMANTIAVVDFGSANVKGTLKRGCAVLTTYPDITGMLIAPDGTSMSTDKTTRSSVTVCSNEEQAESETNNNNKPATSDPWFGFSPTSTLAMLGAGTVFAVNRNQDRCCCCCCCRNPSPSSPTDCGCP